MNKKLKQFSDKTKKTVLRRLDEIERNFPILIESYNTNKTVEERERDIEHVDKIAVVCCCVAVMLTKATAEDREVLGIIAGQAKKTKFFDVAKDLHKILKEYSAFINGLIKSYSSAGKEKNNRQKTICYGQLEEGVFSLFLELLEYVALIEMERAEWGRAINNYHDCRRDNLIWKSNTKTGEEE